MSASDGGTGSGALHNCAVYVFDRAVGNLRPDKNIGQRSDTKKVRKIG